MRQTKTLLFGASTLIISMVAGAIVFGVPEPAQASVDFMSPTSWEPDAIIMTPFLIDFKVETSNGIPWTSPVQVVTSFDGPIYSYCTLSTLTPDANGRISTTSEAPLSAAEGGDNCQVSIWSETGFVVDNVACAFFTDQSSGIAAFPKPAPLKKSGVYGGQYGIQIGVPGGQYGLQINGQSVTMSTPPSYGSVNINNSSGQEIKLAITDYAYGRNPHWYHGTLGMVELGNFSGNLDIFRWSLSPAAEVVVLGEHDTELARGLIRRNGSLDLNVPLETIWNVSVLESTYPDAGEILVVNTIDHVPNPLAAIGSDIDLYSQSRRSVYTLPFKFTGGTFSETSYLPPGDYVAELWNRFMNTSGQLEHHLIDSQSVSIGSSSPTIVFD